MKKLFLPIIAILFLFTNKMQASHLMGGQITVQHLGTDSSIVKLTLYRDTVGVPMDTVNESFTIFTDSACTIMAGYLTFDYNGFSNIGNGVEEYYFSKTMSSADSIYLSDSAAADYYLSWTNCCRNAAISNLSNPSGESMFLQTHYHNFGPSAVNSTPIFLNQPVTTCQINQPWQYNPLPFDADADSLHWYLDMPWNANQTPCVGYIMPVGSALDPFTINPTTGQITWTPIALGNWNATVMVDEYRNGQKIGFIRRDMQILVLDSTAFGCGNRPSVTINGTTVQDQQQFLFTIPSNQNFNLVTNATDIDNNDLKFTIQGEPFILTANPANYTVTNGTGVASANLTWHPQSMQARETPYNNTIRMYEKNVNAIYVKMYDITVQLKVVDVPMGTANVVNTNTILTSSPNPANTFTSIIYSSATSENANIILTDILGRTIKTLHQQTINGSNGTIIPTQDLPNGLYNISVSTKNTKTVGKVLVQH